MPAKSEAQRRLIYARFGEKWAKRHHFDNPGKLPARVTKGKTRHPLTRSMVQKGQI